MAYFGCTVAPGDSYGGRVPAGRPFSAWPASFAPPRSSHARTGGAGIDKSSADCAGGRARRQSRSCHLGRQVGPCDRLRRVSHVQVVRSQTSCVKLTSSGKRVQRHFAALHQVIDGPIDLLRENTRLAYMVADAHIKWRGYDGQNRPKQVVTPDNVSTIPPARTHLRIGRRKRRWSPPEGRQNLRLSTSIQYTPQHGSSGIRFSQRTRARGRRLMVPGWLGRWRRPRAITVVVLLRHCVRRIDLEGALRRVG